MDKANVEIEVIGWLGSILSDTWLVFGDKPEDLPTSYVLVDRTGGPRVAMVMDAAQILIEVYHKDSRQAASDKANEIADAIPNIKSIESITRAEVNSVVKLDDTIAQYFRYQIYCDIYCRR